MYILTHVCICVCRCMHTSLSLSLFRFLLGPPSQSLQDGDDSHEGHGVERLDELHEDPLHAESRRTLIYIYIYIYMYTYIYIYVYIYIYREREIQSEPRAPA